MAMSASIQKVSIKHEMIMNYIMENPQEPLASVAAHFGISSAWLSTVIHSPAFQDRLLEKKDVLFHHTVVATVRDKVSVLAHKALDKLVDQIDFTLDTKELRETADMALERLGYGGKNGGAGDGPTVINNNTLVVARELYYEAQNRIGAKSLQGLTDAINGSVDQPPALSSPKVEEALSTGRLQVSNPVLEYDGGEV